MDSTEAIRYIGIQVLDSMKGALDEDVYTITKKIIETSSRKKLLKKFSLFLKPIVNLHESGEATLDNLKELEYFKEDADISQEKIDQLMQQALLANTLCTAMSEIPPETLSMLENLAGSFTKEFENSLSDESKQSLQKSTDNVNPLDIITKTLSSMNENSSASDLLNEAKKNATDLGVDDVVLDNISRIIPNILSALEPQKTNKVDLLKRFEQIDSSVKDCKKRQ